MMETRDTNDLVTAKGVSPIAGKRDSCSDENTDCHTPPPGPIHTERNKSNANVVYSNTGQTEVEAFGMLHHRKSITIG